MKKILALLAFAVLLTACESNEFKKTPLDTFTQQYDKFQNYSVILYDMDVEEHFDGDIYKHRYKIITDANLKDSTLQPTITDWLTVDEYYFDEHVNDMGMEVMSKANGEVKRETAPAGYNHYVGNTQYGQWVNNSSGGSFWQFYGQYMFMSHMFSMLSTPVYRNYYDDYNRNYRGTGRTYYGSGSTPQYGTFSAHGKSVNPDFHGRTASNSKFKSKVQSSVTRSRSSSSTRSTRSGSRFNSRSSSRSRSSSSRGGK